MITLKSIREKTGSASYTRGNQVYKQGKVLRLEKTEDREMIWLTAEVEGSYDNEYHVQLCYDKGKEIFTDHVCECEAWLSYDGMCKHCVAVALELYYGEKKDSQ